MLRACRRVHISHVHHHHHHLHLDEKMDTDDLDDLQDQKDLDDEDEDEDEDDEDDDEEEMNYKKKKELPPSGANGKKTHMGRQKVLEAEIDEPGFGIREENHLGAFFRQQEEWISEPFPLFKKLLAEAPGVTPLH